MIEWFKVKDNLIGMVMAIFFGIFGMCAVFAFEITSVLLGTLGTILGVCGAAAFKEWRRGKNEIRPEKWYIPYIVGGAIAELITILIGVCVL